MARKNEGLLKIKNSIKQYSTILITFKMNKIVNKFLLTGDNFMPELHLR